MTEFLGSGGSENASQVIDPSGGANQVRVRAYNERLVLSLVRRHGGVSKADIARRTGLSAQTVSVIMRSLERDGLLTRGKPQRGRVGQPSVPMSLNPDGVFSLGLKIGRRSADLLLLDFVGKVRQRRHQAYKYPTPDAIAKFVAAAAGDILTDMRPRDRSNIAGLGVALPFELWNWVEEVGAPRKDMDAWRNVDLSHMLSLLVPFPVFLQNDATAACAAELAFGLGSRYSDFAYFFIGTFIGGGVVLNHALFSGRTGNAGAFGSMPMPRLDGKPGQLIDRASIFLLEKMLAEAGMDPSSVWLKPDEWDAFGGLLDQWIDITAASLAHAIVTVSAVIDFEAIIIDGGFAPQIRTRLVVATRKHLADFDLQGIASPDVEEGLIGPTARAIGAASLPLFSRYHIDQSVLFKEMA